MQEIELLKTNDGIRIIACQMPQMSSISTVIGIKAGSIYENSKQQGISHFIEHMLFKGTEKNKNTLEISRCIEELGGEINASTSEECTFLYSKVLNKNFENALEVMMDILSNSLFREEDINREKAIVIEEINKYQDIPEDWITFLINKLLWKNTVLEQNVLGKKETVKSLNRQLILDYFNKMYNPYNMVISIAGNFTKSQFLEAVDNISFSLKEKEINKNRFIEIKNKKQTKPELLIMPKKINQAHLCFGFLGISRFHPDKINMDLLNIVLGAGLSSRLFQNIRVEEGLAYDIHSYVQYFDTTGSFNIYAGVDPNKIECSIKKVLEELKKIKDYEIENAELRKAKEMYKGSILMGMDSTLNYAFRLGSHLLIHGKEYCYQEIINKIEEASPKGIMKLAENIFHSANINLVIFYPDNISIEKSRIENNLML
ncbi:MAG: pitrilysin family protein [Atribacterota bacterium]|nr:pitrilysin family protein [Atribacterota bacterium]